MKRKINGIVTIPAGIAQANELIIDSPTAEIVGGRQIGNGTSGEVDVELDLVYRWTQGSLDKNIQISREFKWAELTNEQKVIIGQMISESWSLILSIADHVDSTEI